MQKMTGGRTVPRVFVGGLFLLCAVCGAHARALASSLSSSLSLARSLGRSIVCVCMRHHMCSACAVACARQRLMRPVLPSLFPHQASLHVTGGRPPGTEPHVAVRHNGIIIIRVRAAPLSLMVGQSDFARIGRLDPPTPLRSCIPFPPPLSLPIGETPFARPLAVAEDPSLPSTRLLTQDVHV